MKNNKWKKELVLGIILLFVGASFTPTIVIGDQPPEKEWDIVHPGHSCGGNDNIQQTPDGGYIFTAWWKVIKTYSNGSIEWIKTLGENLNDLLVDIQKTTDGGYIVTGRKQKYGSYSTDIWLIKIDQNGNEEWNNTYGKIHDSIGKSVQQTNDGGYIITGQTKSYSSSYDFILIKTDQNGNEEWNKTFGGSYGDYGRSVKQSSDGGYVVVGATKSFGPGGINTLIVKTDTNGNELWKKVYSNFSSGSSRCFQISSKEEYIITGHIGLNLSLMKTDLNGNEQWNKTYHKLGSYSFGYSVQKTLDGGYIIVGSIEDHDIYLVKTDINGNEQWNLTFDNWEVDMGCAVQQTNDGGYIIKGKTVTWYPFTSAVWLIKVSPEGVGNIIYVPDDYSTIQGAVDNANAGDTIIVRDGTYVENVDVNKRLTLRSENGADFTYVKAADPLDYYVFEITADYVNLLGFKINASHYGTGVFLRNSNFSNISNNIMVNSWTGVELYRYSTNNLVLENNIIGFNDGYGIVLYNDPESTTGNPTSNTISDNEVQCTHHGIYLYRSEYNTIENNLLSNNIHQGLWIRRSENNTIRKNMVHDNIQGIKMAESSLNNHVYLNDFFDNDNNVYSYSSTNFWQSQNLITYTYNGNTYSSYLGNYWDDYTGSDIDNDGIGDTPYSISVDNDNYPLVQSFENYFDDGNQPPNPPTLISPGYDSEPGQLIYNLTPTFNWENVSNVDFYTLYISKYPYGPDNIVFDSEVSYDPINGTSFKLYDGILTDMERYRWNMRAFNISTGFSEFSSRLYFEVCLPTWCSISLEKEGIEINEINVAEFFDIHVKKVPGGHEILEVRFSSDDIQESFPTGEWTKWYSWSTSSDDWNSDTKIKRWAFSTSGYKEIWAEVKDANGSVVNLFANIYVPCPALPVIISPLLITPEQDVYIVGESLEAEFTIENIGDFAITLDVLTAGGRLNGRCPNSGCPDFTPFAVTLQPGESYFYEGYFTPEQPGNYHFFVAYYIENPTQEERMLLDENNWNTCVELGDGLSNNDRVKNIIVYEEGTVPEDVTKIRETINRLKNFDFSLPPYLLDANSYMDSIAVRWASFTSFVTRTGLTDRYNELYSIGRDYRRLSIQALEDADRLLNEGNIEGAKEFIHKFYTYDKLSYMSFSSATQVFQGNLEAGAILAKGIRDGCEAAVKTGVSVVFPGAGLKIDGIYLALNFVFDCKIEGVTQAQRNLLKNSLKSIFLKFVKNSAFESLNHNTLEKYVIVVGNKIRLTTLIENEVFMEEFGNELTKIVAEKVGFEVGVIIGEYAKDYLKSFLNSIIAQVKCPVELSVLDSNGRITGLKNKNVTHEIPMSSYYNGTVELFYPNDNYQYVLSGLDQDTYIFEVTYFNDGNITTFTATDIPTLSNAIHQYNINWTALSQGEEGVIVQIDEDSDGIFEQTITSDSELTHDEFMLQTETTIDIDPNTLNLNSTGNWITCYIELPEEYNVSDINISTILLNNTVSAESHPTNISDYDNDSIPDLMVKFDRQDVIDILEVGDSVEISVSGKLFDGTRFEGTDYIKVI